jgi:hypothetical protein
MSDEKNDSFKCGSQGSYVNDKFVGGYGCLMTFPGAQFDYHARVCKRCSSRMCQEFGVEPLDSGALATAISNVHRYVIMIPKLADVPHKSQVRMLLLSVGVEVQQPSEREIQGGSRIKARTSGGKSIVGEIL